MRQVTIGLVIAALAGGCAHDLPVEDSAATQLEYHAAFVDSTAYWSVSLDITNVGQTAVRFDTDICHFVAVVRDQPGGTVITPSSEPGGFDGVLCDWQELVAFTLEPKEKRTVGPILLPRIPALDSMLVAQPHWYQVWIANVPDPAYEGQTDNVFVDIGWRTLSWESNP